VPPRDPRILVVSNRWVPAGSGTPIILYELFRHFPPESVHVLCGPGLRPLTKMSLPFPTTRLTLAPLDRYVSGGYRVLGKHALLPVRAAVEALARRLRPDVIYAHFPDAVFATAAALTAEKLGIPLVTYFDILWEGNDETGLGGFERRVATLARQRFAITETYCEHLSKKHGVAFDLLPHVLVPPSERPARAREDERRAVVHFAGAVYPNMNLDSLQRLHRVLGRKEDPPTFELLGFNRPDEMAAWGLSGPLMSTGSVAREELLERQRTARVLYLPEAFSSASPEMIRHNFPTKALEYMVAGAPILVHAPAESYLSRIARENDWATVVDQPDEDALARGLQQALAGGPVIEARTDRAWEFARSRDGRVWSQKLQTALGL
jgi:Glycosyltransferase Family 4